MQMLQEGAYSATETDLWTRRQGAGDARHASARQQTNYAATVRPDVLLLASSTPARQPKHFGPHPSRGIAWRTYGGLGSRRDLRGRATGNRLLPRFRPGGLLPSWSTPSGDPARRGRRSSPSLGRSSLVYDDCGVGVRSLLGNEVVLDPIAKNVGVAVERRHTSIGSRGLQPSDARLRTAHRRRHGGL